jgi:acid stress-induced BolA-like protein IbaG/YrbA
MQVMQADDIKRLIEQGLPGSQVIVRGADGVHFEATVISSAFVGKSLLQQHRMVYAALGGRLESEAIHALVLKTHTPEAWQQQP